MIAGLNVGEIDRLAVTHDRRVAFLHVTRSEHAKAVRGPYGHGVARGLYDFATSYFAIEYTMNHLGLDPSLHDNIRYGDYESGHMIYIDLAALAQLKESVADFIQTSPA